LNKNLELDSLAVMLRKGHRSILSFSVLFPLIFCLGTINTDCRKGEFTTAYLVVGMVGLALWLWTGLALNTCKYRCERTDNDDVERPVGRITGTLRGRPVG